ncbi:hypothetical protein CWI36_0538p0040 [Hamiltosporidium magnivora]|uniref:Uncharacterized protein n=1 Tax=Hamiltosporidium magnivora TaxID=148818 RepID=A0A4V2JW21_9MICR|nr:hypothetical protein CWI36_0538p0040 [Hamiltosporidium magnivora]
MKYRLIFYLIFTCSFLYLTVAYSNKLYKDYNKNILEAILDLFYLAKEESSRLKEKIMLIGMLAAYVATKIFVLLSEISVIAKNNLLSPATVFKFMRMINIGTFDIFISEIFCCFRILLHDHNKTLKINPDESTDFYNLVSYYYEVLLLSNTTDDIMSLKNNKVPSEDKFTAELLKYGGDFIINNFHNLIKEIWVQEKIPSERNVGLIVLIHKERFKTGALIIREYILGILNTKFPKNNFKKIRAIRRKRSWGLSIWNFTPSMKILISIKMTLMQTKVKVLLTGNVFNRISINIELRQGDTFFWVLFNLTLNTDCTIFNRITQYIANTGHLAIEERNPEVMESTLKILDAESGKYFLIINETKTKYMSYEKERYLEGYITQYLNNNTGFEKNLEI